MTCPSPPSPSRPRLRLQCTMSKPPLPSPRSAAATLTITSSPVATGPVRRGYATAGRGPLPSSSSTVSLVSLSSTDSTDETRPRRSLSMEGGVLDQAQRDGQHLLQRRRADPLVRRVVVLDADRQVQAAQALGRERARITAP